MANPGFMGPQSAQRAAQQAQQAQQAAQRMAQQAAQQAAASARRQAAAGYNMTLQNAARSHQRNHPYRPAGFLGGVGKVISTVVSLMLIAIAVAVFLMILNAVQPDLLNQIKAWLSGSS